MKATPNATWFRKARAERRVAGALTAAIVVVLAVATFRQQPAAEPARDHWFTLHAAPTGAPPSEHRSKLAFGPFETLGQCYAAGALAINHMNAARPDRDFSGGCRDGEALTLRELSDLAMNLLPKENRP